MATPAKMMRTDDLRLSFDVLPNWQKEKQSLLGSDYVLIEPNVKITTDPINVEFDINSPHCLLFGPMTKFHITGGFETRTKTGQVWGSWVPTTEADIAKMILSPNWMEMLIKQIDVFNQNTRITSSNEARAITPYLNTFLYRLMDPVAKKIMCPQDHHFANCLPPWTKDSWNFESEDWKKYGKTVLGKTSLSYDYTPLFCFPFYQGSNHLMGGEAPRILPTPLTGKIQVRITFHDSQDHIFRKKADNTAEYRFTFSTFKLMVEEARLAPAFEKSLLSSKRILPYPGTTRIQITGPVPEGSSLFKTRFQDIYMPESLLVFCLNKQVASNTYKFSATTDQNLFEDHRIQEIQVAFSQKRLYLRNPFPGEVNLDYMETKQYYDHLYHPVCGVPPDVKELKQSYFVEGGKETSYPHLYLSLTNFGTKHRVLPALDDGSALGKRADLEIDFKFKQEGAKKDLIYIIYALYGDVGVTYDTKTRLFANPYNIIIN